MKKKDPFDETYTQYHIIRHLHNETGRKIADLCAEHGVGRPNYFVWLKKLRKLLTERMQKN